VLDGIVALAEEARTANRLLVPPGTLTSTDASWCSRRNGEEAQNVVLADTAAPNHPVNGRPIVFVVLRQTFSRVQGNHFGSSQAMEACGLVRLLDSISWRSTGSMIR
jgi:hypothetical protein